MQGQIPTLIADSQAQHLTATEKLSATLPGQYGMERPLRPLTSVYTYNDISPVVTTEYVHDGEASDPVTTIRMTAKAERVAAGEGGPVMVRCWFIGWVGGRQWETERWEGEKET